METIAVDGRSLEERRRRVWIVLYPRASSIAEMYLECLLTLSGKSDTTAASSSLSSSMPMLRLTPVPCGPSLFQRNTQLGPINLAFCEVNA